MRPVARGRGETSVESSGLSGPVYPCKPGTRGRCLPHVCLHLLFTSLLLSLSIPTNTCTCWREEATSSLLAKTEITPKHRKTRRGYRWESEPHFWIAELKTLQKEGDLLWHLVLPLWLTCFASKAKILLNFYQQLHDSFGKNDRMAPLNRKFLLDKPLECLMCISLTSWKNGVTRLMPGGLVMFYSFLIHILGRKWVTLD